MSHVSRLLLGQPGVSSRCRVCERKRGRGQKPAAQGSGRPLCYSRSATRLMIKTALSSQREDTACSIQILHSFGEWRIDLWSPTLPRVGCNWVPDRGYRDDLAAPAGNQSLPENPGNPAPIQITLIISLSGAVLQDDSASPRRREPNTRRCSGVLWLLLLSPACMFQLSRTPSPNHHSMHAMCVRHSRSTRMGPGVVEQPAEYSASITLTQHAA